jgi:lipid-binding SYLF domain-containing protein
MHTLRIVLLGMGLAALCSKAEAARRDSSRAMERRVAEAVEEFRERVPARFFEEAHSYAVLPSIKRIGFGLGTAWGRGLVLRQDEVLGRVTFWQLTSGIQAGGRSVRMIVFFKDESALRDLRQGRLRFMGQAGVAAFTAGAAKQPGYDRGVAMFASHGFGLMAEASISIGKLAYRPIALNAAACDASPAVRGAGRVARQAGARLRHSRIAASQVTYLRNRSGVTSRSSACDTDHGLPGSDITESAARPLGRQNGKRQ